MIVFPISQEVDYAVLTYLRMYPRGTFHSLYTTRLCSLKQVLTILAEWVTHCRGWYRT